jgi:hypothetical protein
MDEIQSALEILKPLLSSISAVHILLAILVLISLRNGLLIKRAIQVSERTNQRFTDYLQQDAVLRN